MPFPKVFPLLSLPSLPKDLSGMPQLILICIQIICFCLTWALITFEIQPFLSVWGFFTGNSTLSPATEWTVHANYLFAIILVVTGISATIRLKILSHFTSVSITFLIVLWLCFALQPDEYLSNLLKYAYIVLIPVIFHKIFTKNIQHIEKIIKATIQLSLIYVPYRMGLFFFNDTSLSVTLATILTSTFTLISISASLGLYTRKFFSLALKTATIIFTLNLFADIFPLYKNLSAWNFNEIPMAIISSSLIVFTRWVSVISRDEKH